jgi:putative transposase
MQSSSDKKSDKKPASNREANAAKADLLDQLLAQFGDGEDLLGPDGAFTKLKGAVMERLLQAELASHLESERSQGGEPNARNGYSDKFIQTETGPVSVRVPRDRLGTFQPQVIKKHQRRVEGFDDKVLALYARGMTVRDIQAHLKELYGTEVSPELISRATEAVMPEFRDWQSRPLQAVYPVVYLDALFVSVREGGVVTKRAFYVALGIALDGNRDVLGIWAAETEGAKFWLHVLNELKNRGLEDVFLFCADGLSGLDRALDASFPKAVFQTCVVHLIRSALRFVTWADRKEVAAALKPLYTADSEELARVELERLATKYDTKYPAVARTFRSRWEHFVPFLAFPHDVRRILYTTNAIESLNSQLRKSLANRGPFPNDEAVFKLFFLAIRNAKLRWRADRNWSRAIAQFDIFFEGRLPA